jgi:hypothetical protein
MRPSTEELLRSVEEERDRLTQREHLRAQRKADANAELCAKCGARLYGSPLLRPARLCPRHLEEARLAAGPIACTAADIDAGYPEDPPGPDKGILEAVECTRETTCSLCRGPMSPGDWTVKLHGRDTHTHCAGDDGWRIK